MIVWKPTLVSLLLHIRAGIVSTSFVTVPTHLLLHLEHNMCSEILRKEGGKETRGPYPHIKILLMASSSLHSKLLSNHSFKELTKDRGQ